MTGWDRDWIVRTLIENPPWCEKCRVPMVPTGEGKGSDTPTVEIRFECLNFGCGRRHFAVVDPGSRSIRWDNQEAAP
jgi:hypothetical protein